MDPRILELAQKIGAFLLPLLPYLLKMGDKAAEELGKKIGGEAWEKAKALWGKLARKERVQKAAEAAVALPDNPAIRQGVETEIARALEEDPTLLGETTHIVSELKVEVVKKGGKVIGVQVTTPKGPLFIESKVTTGDVAGTVIGVKYEG